MPTADGVSACVLCINSSKKKTLSDDKKKMCDF